MEGHDARRLLILALVAAAWRLSSLSTAGERSISEELERLGLSHGALAQRLADADDGRAPELNGTEREVIAERTSVALSVGDAAALDLALAAESDLADLAADMPDDALSLDERSSLLSTIDGARMALRRMRGVARVTKSDPGIYTKAAGDASRTGPAGSKVFELWFGTNRAPVVREGKVVGFAAGFGEGTTLGQCRVAIPESHLIGEPDPPWWRRIVFGAEPLTIAGLETIGARDFWLQLKDVLADAEDRDCTVFIHGYRNSFKDAALTAAQLGADLGLPGPAAFFSWPSSAKTFAYISDERAIDASEAAIADFLVDFATRSGAAKVHLIAHSMGNRGLLRAIVRIAKSAAASAGVRFGEIVLAAPDVDRRLFVDLYGSLADVSDRTTLYQSNKDLAVRSSRFLHGEDRIGLTPPVTVLPELDTVNVSDVDLSMLGHGYIASCRTVLTDMHQLLRSGIGPDRRVALRSVDDGNGRYWRIAG